MATLLLASRLRGRLLLLATALVVAPGAAQVPIPCISDINCQSEAAIQLDAPPVLCANDQSLVCDRTIANDSVVDPIFFPLDTVAGCVACSLDGCDGTDPSCVPCPDDAYQYCTCSTDRPAQCYNSVGLLVAGNVSYDLCNNGQSFGCNLAECADGGGFDSPCQPYPVTLGCRVCDFSCAGKDSSCFECPSGTPDFCPDQCSSSAQCLGLLDENTTAALCQLSATLICDNELCPFSATFEDACVDPFEAPLGSDVSIVSGCKFCFTDLATCEQLFGDPSACTLCPGAVDELCGGGVGNDPHIWGFEGQSFYWGGGDSGKFHALIHDADVSINGRAAPRYAGASLGYSDLVSLGIATHLEGFVPHTVGVFSAKDACVAAPEACLGLPVHGVGVLVDGKPLRNGLHVVDEGLTIVIANVPHFCKVDADRDDRGHGMFDDAGGEVRPTTSTRRKLQAVDTDVQVHSSSLRGNFLQKTGTAAFESLKGLLALLHAGNPFRKDDSVEAWVASGPVKGAPSIENDFTNECAVWLESKDVFEPRLDGLLTTIMVKTPTMTLRIEHWGFDVDEAATQRAAAGSEPLMLNLHLGGWRPRKTAHGVLGQTVRKQAPGQPPMQGRDDDYVVDSPFATAFTFYV